MGYSNLSQLRALPLDRIKIDWAFLHGVAESDNGAIVTGILHAREGAGMNRHRRRRRIGASHTDNAVALTWQCNCITIRSIHLFDRESTMPATLEVESTLTDRYQTTVPETVRRALRLGKRDKIHYTIRSSGEVVLTRAEASEDDDPVLGQFLGFLARDITSHPEHLQAMDAGLVQRLQSLVGGGEVDLDVPLSADDE